MAKLRSIQILRGLAATAFVANHVWRSPQGGVGLRDVLQVGYLAHLGVMVFFCISGMLMVLTTPQADPGIWPAGRFLRLRVERIYPVYTLWLTILLTIAGAAALAGSGFLSNLLAKVSPEAVIRNYLLLPSLPGDGNGVFIGQAWTLVYEMYFYVVFAGCLLLFTGHRLLLVLCVLIGAPVVCGYLIGFKADREGWINLAYIVTDPLVLNFIMGALFGAWLRRRKEQGVNTLPLAGKPALQWGFVFLALLLCMLPAPAGAAFMHNVASALLLIAVTFLAIGDTWASRQLDHLGDASYSIYVSHVVFAVVAYQAETKLPLQRDVVGVLLTAIAIGVGCLSYRLFEKPVDVYLRARRQQALA